ncbi:hypothetical protein CANCADRAFT_141987 [Tortispora caseinolytica NRRL Y-17796]|uniref:Uncharacterized protein n=1 Tax=Tortispora caseinolytica NRRL Y-17796 TaxID=767744 RepID=A0A1E4TDD6_9ASCO|nr:hypothetical protein CANCADRAFT_141987 [Tortispora caseinolytica NRRL Y-17796]
MYCSFYSSSEAQKQMYKIARLFRDSNRSKKESEHLPPILENASEDNIEPAIIITKCDRQSYMPPTPPTDRDQMISSVLEQSESAEEPLSTSAIVEEAADAMAFAILEKVQPAVLTPSQTPTMDTQEWEI